MTVSHVHVPIKELVYNYKTNKLFAWNVQLDTQDPSVSSVGMDTLGILTVVLGHQRNVKFATVMKILIRMRLETVTEQLETVLNVFIILLGESKTYLGTKDFNSFLLHTLMSN